MLGRPWYRTGFWRYIILFSLAKGTEYLFHFPDPAKNWRLALANTLYTIIHVSKEGWAGVHEYFHVTEIILCLSLTKQKGWMGEYWSQVMSWWYGPSCAQSVWKWPRADIPQQGSNKLGWWVVCYMVQNKQKTTEVNYGHYGKISTKKNQSECLETTLAYNIEFIHKLYKCWFTLLNLRSEMNNEQSTSDTCIKTLAQELGHRAL